MFRVSKSVCAAAVLVLVPVVAHSATIDWVTVGNPGNAPEQDSGAGAVAYPYRISKYEVTNDQYVEFLNAVDATGTNPNSVYNSSMGSDVRGGIAFNGAAANGSKYSSKTNMGNKPVNLVSFFDAMRFVNRLENGQSTDGSGTESGVYTISSGLNETRALGATFFIPSSDEWHKAAYYDPRSATQGGPPGDDNYWLYPTSSDTAPTIATASATGDISNPGTNVANYERGADWNDQNGNVTTVGSAGAGSTSFYGTFDQGGNIYEWNEAVFGGGVPGRGLNGGNWQQGSLRLSASFGAKGNPIGENEIIGFRVASVLEPASLAGDYNNNGVVDAADYPVWRDSLGQMGMGLAADGDGDNMITQLDYDVWKSHFGNTAPGAGSGSAGASPSLARVPEPASCLLLCVAAIVMIARRAR